MQVNNVVLEKGAFLFRAEPLTLRSLGGMDGAVYDFERDNQAYILKFVPTERDRVELTRAKWRFVDYLARNGVAVTHPVLSRNDELIEIVEDDRLYVVFSYEKAPGDHPKWDRGPADNDRIFEAWGQVMGRMHALTKRYDGGSEIQGWQEEHAFFAGWCKDDAVRERWLALGEYLKTLPQDVDGYGLIHNDLHPNNFVVTYEGNQPRITVLDFEVCNHHWFITDMAIALFFVTVGWVRPPDKTISSQAYAQHFWERFIAGYSRENSLDPSWFRHLPALLKHHQILLYIVFSNEWQERNAWQEKTLREWRQSILDDAPVLDIKF